jgi:hypothetical protein
MRLPSCFRRSSSAPEAARLGLAGSMTHSARELFGLARNLSLRYTRPVPYLYILKFYPTLSSRAALSVVPVLHSYEELSLFIR